MKFLIAKDPHYTKLLRYLLGSICAGLFFYLSLDLFLHGFMFGFAPSEVAATLYGDAELFIEPILLDALLLQVHIDLFMSLLSFMIIASVYVRFFSKEKATERLVHTLLILGLLCPVLLLVAYFTSVSFVYIWFVCFVFAHMLGMGMCWRIFQKLLFA